jgi:hypothetical protein
MNKRINTGWTLLLLSLLLISSKAHAQQSGKFLWQIGLPDNNYAEFALAPNGYGQIRDDGFAVIGQFDARRDWPYCQPGPGDPWAGGKPHTFTIIFGLKETPRDGNCTLLIDLLDTHKNSPPQLLIDINGKEYKHRTPSGGGDESIFGNPAVGKEHKFEITFPAAQLRAGGNAITITTATGSWILYDYLALQTPPALELGPVKGTVVHSMRPQPALIEKDGRLFQTIQMSIRHFGDPTKATVQITGAQPTLLDLRPGLQTLDAAVPAVQKETPVTVAVEVDGKTIVTQQQTLKPVRKWELYLLPHSHVDIGYTHVQTDVMKRQWEHLDNAMAFSRKTADYPAGSRFKWNVEVLWAVDAYLAQQPPEKQQQLIDAIKAGWIELDALYGNELTALCRPEELIRLVNHGAKLGQRCGVTVDSAMISDVPGYTWGIVTAMAGAGVRYFSIGPNQGDRIGHTLSAWGDKPFWWIGPDGQSQVLVWIAGRGYSSFHGQTISKAGERPVFDYIRELDASNYPYDMVQVRYNTGGDNGPPDGDVSEFVKNFNARYAYPKLIIATTSELFREFEKRYGDKLPKVAGDFTPYWEDGAASSARETAINRDAAERLAQAESLFAMLKPAQYPSAEFFSAWRNVVLYDEHTWGAHNSISEPDKQFVKDQWKIKQAFALDADTQSRKLLSAALPAPGAASPSAIDVINTTSFARTDLVILSKDLATAAVSVLDSAGRTVMSQRLSTGELAFIASDVPPFAARRYTLSAAAAAYPAKAQAAGATLSLPSLSVSIDEKTGAIASLKAASRELSSGLNSYHYVPGANPKDAQPNGPVKITVKENGPLVASLMIESDAPGANKLSREIRVVDGVDRIDIINTFDKKPIRTKEGVHFGFAFNVPDGVMRMDIPFAVVRPEIDQLKGACKNWFTVQRWVDVSNDNYGATLAILDAPLVEVGAITADVTGGVPWLQKLEPSQTLYSYVMNNYWHTNYKADQDGPTTFRYALRPHQAYDAAAAARFGLSCSQPLIAMPAAGEPVVQPRLTLDTPGVLATLKPSDDGKALMIRLFAASGKPEAANLTFSIAPKSLRLSDLTEKPGQPVTGPIQIPAFGLVTVRAELP